MNITTILRSCLVAGSGLLACSPPATDDAQDTPPEPHVFRPLDPLPFGKADRDFLAVDPPDAPSPIVPHGVLVASSSGDLCRLDPVSGAVNDVAPANAIDLFTSPDNPGMALVSEWNEEGGGAITEFESSASGLHRLAAMDLSIEDTRLVHGPVPTLALGIHEGTTLFSGEEGRNVFPTSSFSTSGTGPHLSLWLLESSPINPELALFQWAGGLYEMSRTATLTPAFACPPRLVREAPTPLIVGLDGRDLTVQEPCGHVLGTWEDAASEEACVQDALWLPAWSEVVVVTGPDVRVHLLPLHDDHNEETLVMADRIGHDPHPHRRLAFDAHRSRLWIALSERLEVRKRTDHGRLERVEIDAGCSAESVALLW
jgi:hypothetical protein